MTKEREKGATLWQTRIQEGREFKQLIGKDGATPAMLLHDLQLPVFLEGKEQAQNVLETGWGLMAQVLHEGGIVTGKGRVFSGASTHVELPSLLIGDLAEEKLITATRLQFEENYIIDDLSEITNQLAEHISFILPGLQEHLYVWQKNNGDVHVRTARNSGKKTAVLLYAFKNMFQDLYAEKGIPEIVSRQSATLSMLGHIAREKGLGIRADIKPELDNKPIW